jgi:hypothetical protein
MATVAILPISDSSGEGAYRAIAGDQHSTGKTASQALDALTAQLGEAEFSTLLVIQNFCSDSFFNAEQQGRLVALMDLWRAVRNQGQDLPPVQPAELDALVEAEPRAATARTAALMQR